MVNPKQKVYIYTRVSTAMQIDGYSLEAQCTRMKAFAEFNNYEIAGEQKYYLADLGFYFATNTDNRINYGPVLENVVYIYAKAKGYAVSVGRIGKLECDFIMRNEPMRYS